MGSRREGEKTEGRVTLFHQSCMFQSTIACCEFGFAAVLSDDEGIRREGRTATSAPEEVESSGILGFGLIGRVDVDEIDKLRDFAEPLQHRAHTAILHRESSNNFQRSQILPNRRERRLCIFGKPHMGCTTAQRLDSNGSRTGVEIDKATATDTRRQDIEESFAQAVAGRTRLKTTWSNELTRAISSCNDTHLWMV